MVQGGIAADTTAILSLALEWGLYGISVILFVHTILVLAKDHKTRPVNRTMAVATCLFFVLSTSHAIVDIVRVNEGFVNERDRFNGGPSAYFADVTQPMFVFRSTLYASQTLLGDAVVIYRCYVVWQSIYLALLPLILWCGCAGMAIALLDACARANPSSIFILGKLIDTFFALSLSCNILGTGLLAYRIWKINAATAGFRIGNSLLPLARVVTDSGALYSTTLLVTLFTFVSGSNSQFLLVDLLMPIIAIAFYAIIIRVSLARQSSKTGSSGSGGQQSYSLAPFQVYIPETQFTADPEANSPRDEIRDQGNDDRTQSV